MFETTDDDGRPVQVKEGHGLRFRWPDGAETFGRAAPCKYSPERLGSEVWLHGVPLWTSLEFLEKHGVAVRVLRGGAS